MKGRGVNTRTVMDVCQAVEHEHRAVQRPGGFELSEGLDQALVRRGAEFPDEAAVALAQTVEIAVGRAEEQQPFPKRWRRIDAAAGGEAPKFFPRGAVESVDGVGLARGDEKFAGGDCGLRDRGV